MTPRVHFFNIIGVQVKRVAVGLPGVALAAAGGLWAQATKTANAPLPKFEDLDPTGIYGNRRGEALRVCALGDSTLTGPGLRSPRDIWLPRILDRSEWCIRLESHAVGGSRISDVLDGQIDTAVATRPDLFVLSIGANDATHGTRSNDFRQRMIEVLHSLTAIAPVAVVGVADVSTVPRIPVALKPILASSCRRLDRAGKEATHQFRDVIRIPTKRLSFGRNVSSEIFTDDLFHLNRIGHQIWSEAFEPFFNLVAGRALTRPAQG